MPELHSQLLYRGLRLGEPIVQLAKALLHTLVDRAVQSSCTILLLPLESKQVVLEFHRGLEVLHLVLHLADPLQQENRRCPAIATAVAVATLLLLRLHVYRLLLLLLLLLVILGQERAHRGVGVESESTSGSLLLGYVLLLGGEGHVVRGADRGGRRQ